MSSAETGANTLPVKNQHASLMPARMNSKNTGTLGRKQVGVVWGLTAAQHRIGQFVPTAGG